VADAKRLSFKDVTLTQLRSFCEVCRLGSYAAAAREVLLTTPAVWEQVHALERHYGGALLERRGHGVAPTSEGERLLALVQPHLSGIDSARELLQQQSGKLPAWLVLATNLRVLTEEISRALARFQRRFPQIKLRVLYTGNDVDQRIARGEADVGFTLEPGPDAPYVPEVTYEAAAAVDYLLVAPRRHPLFRRRAIQLAHITRHPLVLGTAESYSRHRVQEILHRYDLGQELNIAVETTSDEYTLSCVRAGLGVGLMVGTGHGHVYRGLGVRSLRRWFGTARVGFLWKHGAHVPPTQRALAQSIQDCVAGNASGSRLS
jgi:DNA-binding transcriptional LysR family regulator